MGEREEVKLKLRIDRTRGEARRDDADCRLQTDEKFVRRVCYLQRIT